MRKGAGNGSTHPLFEGANSTICVDGAEMPDSNKSPDHQAADQYRREAARLRALADASYLAEVRNDLSAIAQDYEALAQQRDDVARRYGPGDEM